MLGPNNEFPAKMYVCVVVLISAPVNVTPLLAATVSSNANAAISTAAGPVF
jgi:hypothetical protein